MTRPGSQLPHSESLVAARHAAPGLPHRRLLVAAVLVLAAPAHADGIPPLDLWLSYPAISINDASLVVATSSSGGFIGCPYRWTKKLPQGGLVSVPGAEYDVGDAGDFLVKDPRVGGQTGS